MKGVLVVKQCGKVYATMGGITGGPGPNEDSEYEPKPPRERESQHFRFSSVGS